jgi:hypothetical protein
MAAERSWAMKQGRGGHGVVLVIVDPARPRSLEQIVETIAADGYSAFASTPAMVGHLGAFILFDLVVMLDGVDDHVVGHAPSIRCVGAPTEDLVHLVRSHLSGR